MNKAQKGTIKTTQSRRRRLHLAKNWLEGYGGKNKVRGYAKHFKVDLLCTIRELRLLGIEISDTYELAVKQTLAGLAEQKRLKKEQQAKRPDNDIESDDHFGYIIGYTSGGAPYGIQWHDMPDEEV